MAEKKENSKVKLFTEAEAKEKANASFKLFPNRTPLYVTEDGNIFLTPKKANSYIEARNMELFTFKKSK